MNQNHTREDRIIDAGWNSSIAKDENQTRTRAFAKVLFDSVWETLESSGTATVIGDLYKSVFDRGPARCDIRAKSAGLTGEAKEKRTNRVLRNLSNLRIPMFNVAIVAAVHGVQLVTDRMSEEKMNWNKLRVWATDLVKSLAYHEDRDGIPTTFTVDGEEKTLTGKQIRKQWDAYQVSLAKAAGILERYGASFNQRMVDFQAEHSGLMPDLRTVEEVRADAVAFKVDVFDGLTDIQQARVLKESAANKAKKSVLA